MGKPIGFRMKYDDSDLEHDKVLLKCKVSIDGNEDVKMLRCELQEFPVCDRRPTHLASSLDFVPDDVAGEPPVKGLVKQDLHHSVSINRAFAFSRKTITFCRVTGRKPATKTSIDS